MSPLDSSIAAAVRRSLVAVAACGMAIACNDATAPPATSVPAVRGVAVDSVAIGARISIEVTSPTQVLVRYWDTDDGSVLELTRSLSPTDSVVTLTRLAHGRTYRYSVLAVSSMGLVMPGLDGEFTTPPLPADLADLRFQPTGSATEPLTMMEARGAAGFNGFVAVDAAGQVVWYYRTQGAPQGSTQRANGDFVVNDLGYGLREIAPSGEVVHQLDWDFFGPTPHHDVVATPDNTVLFISQDFRTPPGFATIWGEAIYEWVPETGAVTKRWTSWDWYDPASDWGSRSSDLDWLHANSIAIGPHGNVVLSLNWIHQVISIAPDWSRLEWRLGGPRSDFTFDDGAAFSGQHAASMPSEGHVLMFDNGRERTGSGRYSRGLELALDTAAHRASVAWQFRPSGDIFSPYLGYARRLGNGNTEVFFGLRAGPFGDQVASGPIAAFEVAPTGGLAWRMDVSGALSVYRGWPLTSIGGEHNVSSGGAASAR